MYAQFQFRFRSLLPVMSLAIGAGGLHAQVQVSGSVSYRDSLLASENLGNEHFNLLGIGHDPDDGATFLVCSTNSTSDCPSPDNLHIYRLDQARNEWVFDGSIDHPGVVFDSIIDVQGDRVAIGQSFFSGSIGNDSVDIYKRGPGGVWGHEGMYRPADNFVGDFFGFSVSIDGDLLAVGAPQEGDDPRPSQVGPGSVYVYRFQSGSWVLDEKVVASDGVDRDYFGDEVAINATPTGWRLLCSAPEASTDPGGINLAGAVYLIEKANGTLTELDKLVHTTDSQGIGDLGGNGVAMDGGVAAITDDDEVFFYEINASGQFQAMNISGLSAASAFSRPDIDNGVIVTGLPNDAPPSIRVLHISGTGTLSEETVGLPAGINPGDGFGRNVYTDGGVLATGVSGLDLAGENAGGVWTTPLMGASYPQGLILEGAGDPAARFGSAISTTGDWVAIGSPGTPDACFPSAQGSVRLLHASGLDWVTTQFIRPGAGVVGSGFGHAIAMDGDTLAVSMPGFIGELFNTPNGAVFMYTRHGTTWSLDQIIEGGSADDGFGESLVLRGDHMIVSEPGSPNSGSAVHYARDASGVWQGVTGFGVGNLSIGARFSEAMSLGDDLLFVSAPMDGAAAGEVHMFTRSGDMFGYSQQVQVPGVGPGSRAGQALAQSDAFVFIGIPGDAMIPGRVAAYPIQGTSLGAPLLIDDPMNSAMGFGASLSAERDLLVVGYEDPDAGTAYVYAYNGQGYELIQSVASPTGASGSGFGRVSEVGASTVFIGAPDEQSAGIPGEGQVHLHQVELRYTVPECDMDMRESRVQWIEDDTPESGDWYARGIEVDEGYAIVGVPFEKYSYVYDGQLYNANNAGKAVIYERTGLVEWTAVAQFRGSNLDGSPEPASHSDWLGEAVDIEGDLAVAGGTQATDEQNGVRSGSVRIYQRGLTGWVDTGELFPSANAVNGAEPIRYFGSAVDLDSTATLLAVGASNSSIGATGTGAGFVYERTGGGWVESNLLVPSVLQFADHFGESASVEEGWAAFGAPDDHAHPGGAVHIFRRTGLGAWVYDSTLSDPSLGAFSRFGTSIEISRSDLGLTMVVGASGARHTAVNSVGAALVYVLDGASMQWTLHQRLDPEFVRTSASYGADVSIDHNTIAVGGPLIQDGMPGTSWTGGVEMYNLDAAQGGFVRRTTVRPDQSEWGNANGWGYAIGLSGGTVFLGTHQADGDPYLPANNNINSGALIAYDIICVPECVADFDGDGMLSFFDVSQFLAAYSSMDPRADLNGDGILNFFDVSAFLSAYSAGC